MEGVTCHRGRVDSQALLFCRDERHRQEVARQLKINIRRAKLQALRVSSWLSGLQRANKDTVYTWVRTVRPPVRPQDWGDRVLLNLGADAASGRRWVVDLGMPESRLRTTLATIATKWELQ